MKIAFGYKMRSGKDTSVEYLIKKYGGEKISFSQPLYEALYAVQEIFGFKQAKDRLFLQMCGDWARNIEEDVFLNVAMDRANSASLEGKNCYCSDMRFKNEFERMKSDGWVCVKINRCHAPEYGTHISEMDLDDIPETEWDFVINNDGSIEDLYVSLDKIIVSVIPSVVAIH